MNLLQPLLRNNARHRHHAALMLMATMCCCTLHYNCTAQSTPAALRDAEGNHYSTRIMYGNNEWMTANLRLTTTGSYTYTDTVQQNKYGRLYTWEAAKNVCPLLGNGWHLPTADDWRQLAAHYGGIPEDSANNRRKAYTALLPGGAAHFDAVLGGGRGTDGAFARVDAHGFYWMATETDSSLAWFANFGKGSQQLYRQKDGEKADAMAVRCIRKLPGK